MRLETLVSCMYQADLSIVNRSHITSDVLIINQCDENRFIAETFIKPDSRQQKVRMISTIERGLSRSRNMAIRNACEEICLLCDDDEIFADMYEERILRMFREMPDADVIAFQVSGQQCRLGDRVRKLSRLQLLKIKSVQIAFRRAEVLSHSVWFDEDMGAGTGNGAQEENKFLFDCHRAGLKIFYVPEIIATVIQETSTWFSGFTENFFYQRGATTRYMMGLPLALFYAAYYLIVKYPLYYRDVSMIKATVSILKGIIRNDIRQKKLVSGKKE